MLFKGFIGNEEFIIFDLILDIKLIDILILLKVVSILFLDYVFELKKILVYLYWGLLVMEG